MALCLILVTDPSTFSPLTSPTNSFALVSAAPALWAPVANVLGKVESPLAVPQPIIKTNTDVNIESTKSELDSNVRLVATANDYVVVQLDLEGDPNCDYTTKVKIAGSEYNVIIDTGSSHFAVASNVCHDCIVPRKDHYQPGEEEEIPIDADMDLSDSPIHHESVPTPLDHEPLNLIKKQPKDISHEEDIADLLSKLSHPSTTAAQQTITTSTPSVSASPSKQEIVSNSASTIPPSRTVGSTALSSLTNPPTPVSHPSTPSPSISEFHEKVKVSFPSFKNRLNDMWSSLLALPTATVSSSITGSTSSNDHSLEATPGKSQSVLQAKVPHNVNVSDQVGRRLAAAPAENLYPLSDTSLELGQTVRVTYGIKSHSVGWSGVMTSDLMTLEMAKVEPELVSKTESNSLPGELPGTTTEPLRVGGLMEKETNVEFAAITENNGFFSKECGAQHGIWGLGYRSLSVDRKPTLFDTLSASMKIPNGFALQLCGRTSNVTKSGNMFLGGYSSAHVAEPMQYVPLVKKDWYQVRLDGFKVMGQPVQGMQNLNLPKTIVDSGTTNILMSHYNLQFLIQSLSRSQVVRWSNLIPQQDIDNFWFQNAVLRLPRSTFQVSTAARAVEVVISGISIPIYTSSFLKIKAVPEGQAPEGYVDFWWHGFASSTSPDAVEAEAASGGAVMPGSVGTILGETLFSGKVVYFERGNDDAEPGDADYGRIGFARGKNCFAPANHDSVNVLASGGKVAIAEELGPVRTAAATSKANAIKKSGRTGTSVPVHAASTQVTDKKAKDSGIAKDSQPSSSISQSSQPHFPGLSGPIRLMGSASHPFSDSCLLQRVVCGLLVAIMSALV
ncbi:Beta-site APP-cleaving enzyme [Mortierella sp. AD094]|nr:Beta-site APP-cleaving enzyme [Mortierella sp. AD094]